MDTHIIIQNIFGIKLYLFYINYIYFIYYKFGTINKLSYMLRLNYKFHSYKVFNISEHVKLYVGLYFTTFHVCYAKIKDHIRWI